MFKLPWYLIPLIIMLWFTDGWVSDDHRGGWERNSVYNSQRRWANQPRAKLAIMGSSTSKDWLPGRTLTQWFGLKRGEVLDAHINGCHQGCTWAQVRAMKRQRRRFKYILYGTNQFQMCEDVHSKRVLQQQMMLPRSDIPHLFSLYLDAQQPLQYMARFMGMNLSGAYGDTRIAQTDVQRRLLGRGRRGHEWRWIHPRPKKRVRRVNTCDYHPDHVAYKESISRALYRDMAQMGQRVFIMLLPDPSVAMPQYSEVWARHRAFQEALTQQYPNVYLIDLVNDGAQNWSQFRDAIHLHKRAMPHQLNLFKTRLNQLGLLPRRHADQGGELTPQLERLK